MSTPLGAVPLLPYYLTISLSRYLTTSLRHYVTTLLRYYVTTLPRYHVTTLLRYYITTLLLTRRRLCRLLLPPPSYFAPSLPAIVRWA